MRTIYFDNAATTQVYPEVAEIVTRLMCRDFGNPSSMHLKGMEAEREIRTAAKTLAELLKVKEKEIIFTSGGTESDNWAIIGTAAANARRGKHIITTAVEHAAVSAPVTYLEEQGFRVTRLGVDKNGQIDLSELEAALTADTILVSIMFVNNEVGSIQPIARAGSLIKEKCPGAFFHTDAVQAFGKIPVLPGQLKVDMLSVSAHKIHGPKGAGLLYVNEKVKIDPLIRGGGQQRGLRSGTDNVPGAAGLAAAAAIAFENMEKNAAHMRSLRDRLAGRLRQECEITSSQKQPLAVVKAYDPGADYAPHILNASFPGVRSEVLLHALEERGIYVSAGSACSSHKRRPSATLLAMGYSNEESESALRFSFCPGNTEEEVDLLVGALRELLPLLRRFTRK